MVIGGVFLALVTDRIMDGSHETKNVAILAIIFHFLGFKKSSSWWILSRGSIRNSEH